DATEDQTAYIDLSHDSSLGDCGSIRVPDYCVQWKILARDAEPASATLDGIQEFCSVMLLFSRSPRAVRSPLREWGLRDWAAGVALFAATAGVVLWQNAHVAVLFDLSYILNTATRIAQGQVPYRDFPLAHAPLTFLLQAAIIRLTGRVFFHDVLYVAIVGGLGTVFTWRIALAMLRGRLAAAWAVAMLVAAPIVFVGVYGIVPNPEYDCDCAFWILVAVWLLLKLDRKTNAAWGFAAGVFICVPLFFKQNMGLPFLVAAIGAVLLVLALEWLQRAKSPAAAPL